MKIRKIYLVFIVFYYFYFEIAKTIFDLFTDPYHNYNPYLQCISMNIEYMDQHRS